MTSSGLILVFFPSPDTIFLESFFMLMFWEYFLTDFSNVPRTSVACASVLVVSNYPWFDGLIKNPLASV
jgi:hypothetical protein